MLHQLHFLEQKIPSIFITENMNERKVQTKWYTLKTKSIFEELLDIGEPKNRARLLASSQNQGTK